MSIILARVFRMIFRGWLGGKACVISMEIRHLTLGERSDDRSAISRRNFHAKRGLIGLEIFVESFMEGRNVFR